ncbi:MAG TPA: hypothetical protein VFZ49_02320 [Pyrinomonadaceae bacterium]
MNKTGGQRNIHLLGLRPSVCGKALLFRKPLTNIRGSAARLAA